jgi:hypothetical protein
MLDLATRELLGLALKSGIFVAFAIGLVRWIGLAA